MPDLNSVTEYLREEGYLIPVEPGKFKLNGCVLKEGELIDIIYENALGKSVIRGKFKIINGGRLPIVTTSANSKLNSTFEIGYFTKVRRVHLRG